MPTQWTQDWTARGNPLQIDSIPVGDAGGMIGITSCPGARDGWRDANLGTDLETIFRWNPQAILTLIEADEIGADVFSALGKCVQSRGVGWHHLPIVDFRPPDERFETRWATLGPELCRSIEDGARVLVHCYAGLGRAGSVAALMLIGMGFAPPDAIALVRAARPGAIQTRDQERYVRQFSQSSAPN